MRLIVVALLALLASACTANTGPLGSCTFSSGCYDILEAANPSGFCASGGGSYSGSICPTPNRVGRCTVSGSDGSGGTLTYTINTYAPRTTDEARSGCTGNFTAN